VRQDYGFSAHSSGELAAFDRANGKTLARLPLEGPVIDLAWDSAHERALVVVQTPELEARLLAAVTFDGSELAVVAHSEPISGAMRVRPWAERALLLSQELATSFSLLDPKLLPIAPSKALFLPAAFARAPDPRQLYALDANRFEAGLDHDALLRLSFEGSWQLEQWLIPAPGRPGSRLAQSSDPDSLWLVRKPIDAGVFEIAELDAVSPAAPTSFRSVELTLEPSSLVSVLLEPAQRVLIATLSRDELGGGHGALALLPLVASAPAALIPVDGFIESSAWPTAALAHDPETGRVLVGSSSGVHAYVASGDAAAPGLILDASFGGAELRPPFVLAMGT
jgi:hypothetical protein